MADESFGGGMRDQLMQMLEYRVVLGALVTTMDGLVITHEGSARGDRALAGLRRRRTGIDRQGRRGRGPTPQ